MKAEELLQRSGSNTPRLDVDKHLPHVPHNSRDLNWTDDVC